MARIATPLALLGILLLFATAVAWHIDLPGLYMDAVNPDYLVVDLINGPSDGSPIWILPRNLIWQRIPLLTSLYHGTLQMWLALPFVALFGPTVASLRSAQALAGAMILMGMYFFVRDSRVAPRHLLAWLPAAALAVDPVFVYAFRTQLYIQLCPVALLLAALLAARRALHSADARSAQRWWFAAGLCYGLSVFGYFIFLFFAPAIVLAIVLGRGGCSLPLRRALSASVAGFLVGISGYFFGCIQILRAENGFAGFAEFFAQYQHSLGAFEQHRTDVQSVGYFAVLIWRVFSNDWQHSLMFGDPWPEPGSALKMVLLLVVPALFWVWFELRGTTSWRLRLILAMIACFPLVALIFGDRLSGHHFVVLLPLAYLALALATRELAVIRAASTPLPAPALAIWFAIIVINLLGLRATDTELLATHGRGLFSDAINRLASDAIAKEKSGKQFYIFPDWGLYLPFHYLTDGKIRHAVEIDTAKMRKALCGGQPVSVALISGDVATRFRELAAALPWNAPVLVPYLSYENQPVFTVGTFRVAEPGARNDASCHTVENP